MGIKIDTLPPALRAQVEAKLMAEDKLRRSASSTVNAHRIAQDAQDAQDESGCTQTRPETSGRDTRAVARRKRQPNKTEARYAAEMLRGLDARYEAVTFRLSNGHRYTPDWVVFDSAGRLLSCHEVKGSYRFHSHGRARLAFDQARVEIPGLFWVWAVLQKDGSWKHTATHPTPRKAGTDGTGTGKELGSSAEGRKGRFRANGDGLAADRSHGTRRGAFCFEVGQ